MICLDEKVCFLHVPRTAGTSMERAMRQGYGEDRVLLPAYHYTAGKARDVVWSHGQDPDTFFFFSFVRNPYSRAWSIYNGLQRVRGHPEALPLETSFREWATGVLVERINREPAANGTYFDQVHWILDTDDAVGVTWLGRFERLPDDWQRVCKHLRLESVDLPVTNLGEPRDWWNRYDEDTAAAVTWAYRRDFNWLGYDRELKPGRRCEQCSG